MDAAKKNLLRLMRRSEEFKSFPTGTEFQVAANQSFQLKVEQTTADLCVYG